MSEVFDTPAKWDANDLLAITALTALPGPYVPWSAWSMRPSAVATVVNEIVMSGPRTIVEIGAGASTLYFARAAEQAGATFVSVEDDARWADGIRRLLPAGRSSGTRIEHVPLAPLQAPLEGSEHTHLKSPARWYDAQRVLDVVPDEIDMLVVDGPTAGAQRDTLVRAPAVPILGSRLAEGYTVVLDDANRHAELETAHLWQQQLQARLMFHPRTNLAVLRNHDAIFPSL